MKFYITHYTPLTERKQHIISSLQNANITDYEFIESYDRDILTQNDIKKFSNITRSEISLFLKHVDIFKKGNDDAIVVLEDDAVLVDNFKEKLENYMKISKSFDYDIIVPGECCNLHANNITPNQIFYRDYSVFGRGTCMYILNKSVCKKLYDIYNSESIIVKPVDHWLSDMMRKYNLIMYWTEPTLVFQGSQNGKFKSAVR